jgi:hypothetical protein
MKDAKIYKDEEQAKCLIAFDAATQGLNMMTFEDFEKALHHAGKMKNMSGTDLGLIVVHKAMKIVEEESSKGVARNRGPPTKESLKEEIRKQLAKGKEKVDMRPPPAVVKMKKRRPPPVSKPSSSGGSEGEETDAKAKEDEKDAPMPEKEEEDDDDDDEVDFKAIAARNQYLEQQAKLLADLNAQLKKGEAIPEKQLKREDRTYTWDKSPSGTINLEHPAHWDNWG